MVGSMSPDVNHDSGLVLVGPIPQDEAYHDFAEALDAGNFECTQFW